MGPRSHERGNEKFNDTTPSGLRLLQWGRVLMNAETSAAPAFTSACVPLQWARVLMNAETAQIEPLFGFPEYASMGPRSHERGNQDAGLYRLSLWRLQWGRVLMNAETPASRSFSACSIASLQWGRVLMNAETDESRSWRRRNSACFNGAAFS